MHTGSKHVMYLLTLLHKDTMAILDNPDDQMNVVCAIMFAFFFNVKSANKNYC